VGPLQRNILLQNVLKTLGLGKVPQIAVDGGGAFAVEPVLWAGDGDSGPVPNSIPAFLKTNQDMTDLRFCLEGIRSWDWKELHIFGFLGERKDHELANLGEIYTEFKNRPKFSRAVFYSAQDRPHIHFFQAGETKFGLHGTFSVFTLETGEISINGKCRYQADKLLISPLSGRGISNEAFGEVEISCTHPFFVIVT
jgi:thiamine pyrophosphokinase